MTGAGTMRRWVKVSVAAAVVLGVGGYVAQSYAKEWALINDACGGGLPRDAVEQLTPEDSFLDSEETESTKELGSYSCEVTLAGGDADGKRFVSVAAYTRRDDQDREFMSVFEEDGFIQQAPLPDGMPGFVDQWGAIRLLLTCPDLPADDDGRKRKLLVSILPGRDVLTGVPGDAHRTAIALTDMASEQLGCGAKPLKAPEQETPLTVPSNADDPKRVPVARVEGTSCGWVTEAGLPASGDWQVTVGPSESSPSGRCALYSAGDEDATQDHSRLSLASWYGDWSNRLTSYDGKRRSMTATARCEGEAANYALVGSQDIPGVDVAAKQRILKLFVQDEVRRHGCSAPHFHF